MNDDKLQAIVAAMHMIYDEKFVQMMEQMLQQTKGGKDTEDGITHAVAAVAGQILQPLLQKVQLSEEDTYGKEGLVHVVIDSLFEVAKHLGYKTRQSEAILKEAYQLVEQMLEEGSEPMQESPQAEAQEQQAPAQAGPQPAGLFGGM